jgi:predicted ATPase
VGVLVTSREPLGMGNEVVWRVPSLRTPAVGEVVAPERLGTYEAARLLLDRARRVRPKLVVDNDTAAHVVAVCTRLDGIPLALELAAARVRTVPLDRLAGGLADAFRLLTGGARTALPRQQTLLASITWSVDLLDDTERAVLRRLAVFRGPFPLEAAEAVAADDAVVTAYAVLDIISRLVDKSLVVLDDETGHYRLLETIRQFAIDRLRDAGELAITFERHAGWYTDWCESLGRGEHDFDIGPSHPLLTDVFAALDWAYDARPAHAYRISRGLAGVRALLGRYADFDRQYTWLAARDGGDDAAGWAAAVAGLSYFSGLVGRT